MLVYTRLVKYSGSQYLNLLYDGLELGRTVGPLLQQLHGLVKVLHVLAIHFEEGCEFLQDVSYARCGPPGGERENSRWVQVLQTDLNHNCMTLTAFSTIYQSLTGRIMSTVCSI